MRELTHKELETVGGGEVLISPGQIGIALTDNTLVVVTGLTEASTLLRAFGMIGTALGTGYAIGSALVNHTNIENVVGGWMYGLSQCFN